MMKDFRAAAVQFAPQSMKVEENLARMATFIEKAAQEGNQLVVFPELSDTGYVKWPTRRTEVTFAETMMKTAHTIPGASTEALAEAARKNNVYVISGLCEKDKNVTGRLFNSCVLIDPAGTVAGLQRKISAPMAETFYFNRGDTLEVYETELGKIGMLVCYDNLYPEPARVLTLKGMEVLAMVWNAAHPNPPTIAPDLDIPTGYQAKVIEHVPIIRGMENVIFVVSSSRVGDDEFSGGRFLGNSVISSPWGEPLALAGLDEEKMISAELNLELLPLVRSSRVLLKDRRPELYQRLIEL